MCFAALKFDLGTTKQWSNCNLKRKQTVHFWHIFSARLCVDPSGEICAEKSNRTVNPHLCQTSAKTCKQAKRSDKKQIENRQNKKKRTKTLCKMAHVELSMSMAKNENSLKLSFGTIMDTERDKSP
jgi:hypothetical protein